MDIKDLAASRNRVLFVDDEPGVLEALTFATLDEDWEVLTAGSGPEGLELLEHTPVALVVSDYRMPGMTGVEFLRAVCERFPRTGRMILSGYAEAHAVVAAINEGHVNKFIAKPWKDEELLDSIRAGLEKYALEVENDLLHEAVSAKNRELEEINATLERKVHERTLRLEARNRALTFAHEVLNQLPYGLFGIDRERRLMITNAAAVRFSVGAIPPFLGEPIGEWLPAEAHAITDQVLETGEARSGPVTLKRGPGHADCVPLGEGASRGVILILREEVP